MIFFVLYVTKLLFFRLAATNGLLLVTLTLSASRDIKSVLSSLTKILELEPKEPFANANGELLYEIIERIEAPQTTTTTTTPSPKQEDVEEATWPDGKARFCKHCAGAVHPKKAIAKILIRDGKRKQTDPPSVDEGPAAAKAKRKAFAEEVLFCGESCYSQTALVHTLHDVPDPLTVVQVIERVIQRNR